MTAKQLANATRQDPLLGQIKGCIRDGWPMQTDAELQPYRNHQRELTTEGQIVLWGNRVIIPVKLRRAILEELHRNHPGATRMKGLARSYMYLWWPGLDKDLEKCVKQYGIPQRQHLCIPGCGLPRHGAVYMWILQDLWKERCSVL